MAKAGESPAEQAFIEFLRYYKIDGWVTEYKFAHPRRNWRFDFAWLSARFAVEIEGVTRWGAIGRHQSPDGFLRDAEKYEAALMRGWTVYRVPSEWIIKREGRTYRRIWRPDVAEVIKRQLNLARLRAGVGRVSKGGLQQ